MRQMFDGSVNVIEAAAAAGVEKVVYTSSVATLGVNSDGSPADEETPVSIDDMIGHYKRSKYLAEAAVGARARELGLALVTVNPSTPVGPGDVKPTPTGRIILDAAAGRTPAYVDTGLNVVHVDDVAAGHVLALKSGTPRAALHTGWHGPEPAGNLNSRRSADRAVRPRCTPASLVRPVDRSHLRGLGRIEGYDPTRESRWRADGGQAYVFLKREGEP